MGMIARTGANLLPTTPPNVAVAVFSVVAVVDAVFIVFVVFGESDAPLETIKGLLHLVLFPCWALAPQASGSEILSRRR